MKEKIAVICNNDSKKVLNVTSFVKGEGRGYDFKAECISLSGGSNASERYYRNEKYTLISYEDFERNYLKINKELEIEIW